MESEFIEKKLDIENYEDLKFFISKYWREDHPIVQSENLFKWQYFGFGLNKGYSNFQLLYFKNELIGFRAVIPEEIQIPIKNSYKIETCFASAMWMVSPEFRGRGLGYKMHNNTEKKSIASLAIGANPKTSVPLYLRSGYHELKALNRYIIPLSFDYKKLCIYSLKDETLLDWLCKINLQKFNCNIDENKNIDDIENIWNHSVKNQNIIALNRSKEFWEWRYKNSPIFKYYIFGNKKLGGIIVVRIEDVFNDTGNLNLKVLRILEIIPYEFYIWKREIDFKMVELIGSVLNWGKKMGCSAADFHCSTNKFNNTLEEVGFATQPLDYLPEIYSLSGVFQPILDKPYYYNCYLRLNIPYFNQEYFNYDNTYFVRSDTDQDRPNMI